MLQPGFAHALTTGNHWADKTEIRNFLHLYPNIVVPFNIHNRPQRHPGFTIIESAAGCKVAVINAIGTVFMHPKNSNPFQGIPALLAQIPEDVKIRIVDFHAEATSEKQAFGHFLDGQASLVYGTHTHCPTADARVLPGGSAFITDVGMTGSYDSVIGLNKERAIERFLTGQRNKFLLAKENLQAHAIAVDINVATGKSLAIRRLSTIVNC